MKRKTLAQPAKPQHPYVTIERKAVRRFDWVIVDPADRWHGIYSSGGQARSLRGAQRKSARALQRYLVKKGYQRESWTLTLEES